MPPRSSNNMTSHRPTSSSSLSYGRHQLTNRSTTPRAADVVLLDATDIKWKLYGKNEHFKIVQEAVVKIQAFVRGSMSRGKTSDMIQELIDGILSYREIVAKYAAEDEARVKKQQLGFNNTEESHQHQEGDEGEISVASSSDISKSKRLENKPWLHPDNKYTPSGTPIELRLKEQLNVLDFVDDSHVEQYQKKHDDNQDREEKETSSSTSIQEGRKVAIKLSPEGFSVNLKERLGFWESQGSPKLEDKRKEISESTHDLAQLDEFEKRMEDPAVNFPEEFIKESVAIEPGGRGYHRYKTSSTGRNKRRPWRDDTNVFDAY